MEPIRLILADDHALVRAGFRSLLSVIPDIQVVAEATNGREALHLIEKHHPDMVLMDIAMSGMNGLEATRRLSQERPQVRVIVLSMYANEEYVLGALRAGATSYLLKDADSEELEQAIRSTMRGEAYFSPQVSQLAITQYEQRLSEYSHGLSTDSPFTQLTPRQREILQLIAEGHSTKQIAHLLHISAKTVETHRTQLMDRLHIYDVVGLVRYAIRHGMVPSDQ
ncbi:MAG TPA: response regulator transcription factor [Abditibacteriaceae bacterium]|jgi:DNA-binding NarL/FixJ family response regulator